MSELHHHACPTCGRLFSTEVSGAWWCAHSGANFQAHPPSWPDPLWSRMVPVESYVIGELSADADRWVVIEQQNPYSRPDGDETDYGTWHTRVVSEPGTYETALIRTGSLKDERRRPGWPSHGHSFRPIPLDIVGEYVDEEVGSR